MRKIKVNMILDILTIHVEAKEGESDKDVLVKAEEILVERLRNELPHYNYEMVEGSTLVKYEAYLGKIVRNVEHGYGIIVKCNKKTVKVVFPGMSLIKDYQVFLDVGDMEPRDVMWLKEENRKWEDGDCGFLDNGEEGKVPVVIGQEVGDQVEVIVIGDKKGRVYHLAGRQLRGLVSVE